MKDNEIPQGNPNYIVNEPVETHTITSLLKSGTFFSENNSNFSDFIFTIFQLLNFLSKNESGLTNNTGVLTIMFD